MSHADTIFALATPPGKSGVAVLRLSGPGALPAMQAVTGLANITPRYAHYTKFSDPNSGTIIDRGLALFFPSPHSFTGEDIVEFHIHGSLAIIRQFLSTLAAINGFRPAEAGEFTRRAFANGKMDLLEAEGLADLIDAQTIEQKSQALRQMQGELSDFYHHLRTQMTRMLALLEAYIDFPDEEIPDSVLSELGQGTNALQSLIHSTLADQHRGERLRDGITIVILGAPNAGKSSLINAIAKRDVAIVSHKAGTTRDIIEVYLDIAGYPVTFVDTAGIRNSDEDIEAEGIRRALARAETADIKLVLFDGAALPQLDSRSLQLMDAKAVMVVSKCDQLIDRKQLPANALLISATEGTGIDELIANLQERVVTFFTGENSVLITRTRHRALLEEACNHLEQSTLNLPLELKCEALRLAAQAIGKITGVIRVDDVLEVIFRSFCIGK